MSNERNAVLPAPRGTAAAQDRRNQHRVLGCMLVWMGSWLAMNFAISMDWLPGALPVVLSTLLTTGLGIVTAVTYWIFLREADELRRKVELEALAVAFAVGVVSALSYWLLTRGGLADEQDWLFVIVAMMLTHGLGVFVGQRRYA